MGAFNNATITDAGKELLANTLSGSRLIFTRMGVADKAGNSLSMDINRTLRKDGTVTVEASVYSEGVSEGIWATDLNLYAKSDTTDEVLFMTASDDNPDYIPAKSENTATYTMQVAISDTSNISFISTGSRLVSMDILNDILLAKELPVTFTADSDGNITITPNTNKKGVPDYDYGYSGDSDVTDEEISEIVGETYDGSDGSGTYDGYDEATESDIKNLFT